jgi:hypothetical protein
MLKGKIEWECNSKDGLTLHIDPGSSIDTGKHLLRQAIYMQKDILLALRSLVDAAIQKSEEKETADNKDRTRIKVE